MAIHKKPNGKYLVDMLDEHGTRVERTFNRKIDAEAFERKIQNKKYERKLVGLKLVKTRYSIDDALTDYLNTKSDLRSKSVQKYRGVVSEIRNFVQSNGLQYVDEFSPDYASIFFNLLISEKTIKIPTGEKTVKAKPRTINFYLRVLKAFFRYEILKNHIEKDPTLHLKNVKVEKQRPEYYSVNDINLFFQQPMDPSYKNAFLGLFYSGVRISELTNITYDDLDFIRKHIIIRPKGTYKTKTFESERRIPMNKKLNELLKEIVRKKLSDTYPFCNPKGSKLSGRTLLDVCKRTATRAGIKDRAFLHKYRHSYASHLVLQGIPLESIQMFLGHSSIVQTQQYAHNKPDHLHNQVSVLDSLIDERRSHKTLITRGKKRLRETIREE